MSRTLSARAGMIVLALASFGNVALGTTVQRLDFKGLTALSTNVVIGTIGGSRFERTPDGGMIVTLTELTVTEQWKGEVGATALTLSTPGGRIGNEVIDVSGVPVFQRTEQALLFLEKNPNGTYGVISFAQGSYKLGTAASGERIVTRDVGALSLVAVSGKEKAQLVEGVWTLATVKADVDAQKAIVVVADESPASADETVVPLNDVDPKTGEVKPAVKGGGR